MELVKLKKKEDELDDHVRTLSKLETEKLDLVEGTIILENFTETIHSLKTCGLLNEIDSFSF